MIILGLDPGTTTTGFGLINFDGIDHHLIDYGCISTTPKASIQDKISEMMNDLDELLKTSHPDQVCIEELFFSKNVKTGIQVAESRGAMVYKISQFGFKLFQYKPNVIKQQICGDGNANKESIQKMVKMLLNISEIPKPDDAADALAIAICHANHLKQMQILKAHA